MGQQEVRVGAYRGTGSLTPPHRCGSKLDARSELWSHFLAWLEEEVLPSSHPLPTCSLSHIAPPSTAKLAVA